MFFDFGQGIYFGGSGVLGGEQGMTVPMGNISSGTCIYMYV